MRIGLINLEPKIINTALMQISQHHKERGDTVEWALPLEYNQYDKLYCSSLFDFTNKEMIPQRTICGGTGFNLTTKLPFDCDYDYSIYPNCDYSIVWFSRGCFRNCSFCVVRQKEGYIRPVAPKNLNPNGEYIVVQDNNFFGNPDWKIAVMTLAALNMRIKFDGVDVRILNRQQCDALNHLKIEGQIGLAWDNPRQNIIPKFKEITKYIRPYKIKCYVLIGYWSTPEEDLYRVEELRKLKIDPFVMPYKKSDPYQKAFARWVNKKEIFKTVKWEDYGRVG